RTISCPPGLRRSTVIDFLLRACTYHHNDVPSWSSRHCRSGSPPGALSDAGGSTLITSAPNSANTLPANGPAISCPSSRTLSPASGRVVVRVDSMRLFRVGAHRVRHVSRPGILPRSDGIAAAARAQRCLELRQLRRHRVPYKNLRVRRRAHAFRFLTLGDAFTCFRERADERIVEAQRVLEQRIAEIGRLAFAATAE